MNIGIVKERYSRIKNQPRRKLEKDFHYSTYSFLMLLIFGGGAGGLLYWFDPLLAPEVLASIFGGLLGAGVLMAIFPLWTIQVVALFLVLGLMGGYGRIQYPPAYVLVGLGVLLSASVQLVFHWDKVVVLRFGRFRRVRDAGIFILLPIIDRIADFVDTRIRVTDFSAERTLTRDNVPVHIDALCFWMIWDAGKAILEVENYIEAVTLSAQTALRDAIGKNDLAKLLSEREDVGRDIQQILDAKTSPWGISILSVEFTDILIPKELEDAMSRKAQAERERQARIILGTAEAEVASKFEEASRAYVDNPAALQLRAMNMVYEGMKYNKNSLMLLPSSALESMNMGTLLGAAAFQKQNDPEKSGKENTDD
ncbi:slipin family protein [Marispirochaeta aestuarii]|uniref:slipin family protein n=1 Tax=Marispirochaeta aestuarii TaxID=1963862 RepID=UPI0029C70037|nr:slipin family protein [Marispirochaeta aestuarii]